MAEFKKFGARGDRSGRGKGSFGGEKRASNFGGDRGFGAGRNGEYVSRPRFDKGSRDREMFQATCDSCSNSCQVPFKPSGDKPVLCDNCFSKKREDSSREYKSSQSFGERNDRAERPARNFAETNTPRPDQKINDLQMKLESLTSKVSELVTITKTLTEKLATMEVKPTEVTPKAKTVKKAAVKKEVVTKVPAKKASKKK